MSNPRGPEWSDPTQAGYGYPPTTDPAYSPYATGYGQPMTQPTEQLPPVWHTGYPQAPPPPPRPPKSPRWLWIAAGATTVLVLALALALVILNSSARESTVVAPPETTSRSTPPPTTTRSTAPTRIPIPIPIPTISPAPTESTGPSPSGQPETPTPTGTETVVYAVSGEGRAINITFVDAGGIMQTEFNVALPWSKEVILSAPARTAASVAVVNVGRDVTCSVTINGAQVRQRTGRGLTICTGLA